jgi:hypothetical protein
VLAAEEVGEVGGGEAKSAVVQLHPGKARRGD